jgi:transposase
LGTTSESLSLYEIQKGKLEGKKILVFLDERLKTEEEKDYLSRIKKDQKKYLETFFEHRHQQGTIAVITDLNESGERIYNLLKSRAEIEAMFDIFKNILNADRTCMRDDYQLEGWMFINFIALVFYYRLYGVLEDNSLLKKYSPNDVFVHLSRIYKLKIQDQWIVSEIPKKTRGILDQLGLDPPIT